MRIPIPEIEDDYDSEFQDKYELRDYDSERIKEFLNKPKWICKKCHLTNHGSNKYCADWKCNHPISS